MFKLSTWVWGGICLGACYMLDHYDAPRSFAVLLGIILGVVACHWDEYQHQKQDEKITSVFD